MGKQSKRKIEVRRNFLELGVEHILDALQFGLGFGFEAQHQNRSGV